MHGCLYVLDYDFVGHVLCRTEIEWYPGRCLTKNTIEKNSKKGSFPKGTEYRKSFFNFFSTPQVLEDIDAVRNQMEIDYEIG